MSKISIWIISEIMQANKTVVVKYDVYLLKNIKTDIKVLELNIWDFIGDFLIESEIKTKTNRQDIILIMPTNKTDGEYYSEYAIKELLNCQLETKYIFLDLRQPLLNCVAFGGKEQTHEKYYTDVT